uniref:RNA methyltransferase n=1 Tax=Strigamia maritima TaxID=126957 RepID=T1IJC9_STRMM
MPQSPEMASNLKIQTAGKYDIVSMHKDLSSSPMKKTSCLKKTDFSLKTKRKNSFGASEPKFNGPPFKKKNKSVPPTKFLLGGNINDPLNLGSLADEEINRSLNESTPYSSPMPTPKHRNQVEVLIPQNINDPLNLNAGDDANLELNFTSPKSKRRKYRKRKKQASGDLDSSGEKLSEEVADEPEAKKPNVDTTESPTVKTEETRSHIKTKRTEDKIVSPVIPQPGMRKRSNTHPKSREEQEKEKEAVLLNPNLPNDVKKPVHKEKKKEMKTIHYREKDIQFQYGNYNRYYGYRNPDSIEDYRLKCMNPSWFEGKDILDIGCNVGFVTLSIAKDFKPQKIIGMDIDKNLIKSARNNVRHYINNISGDTSTFPKSLAICYGPLITQYSNEEATPTFPNNVFFVQGNYVLDSNKEIEKQKAEYDTILCLSLTKWIHLNWGDDGLRRLFKRMYAHLRPGGRMILEAQSWPSYGKKKKLTETIFNNYRTIQFKPQQFTEYLLSKEVGFTTCEVIDTPFNQSKGFRRPIQLFTKGKNDLSPGVSDAGAHSTKEKSEK